MVNITGSIRIKKDVDSVYAILRAIDKFPEFMHAVKKIRILKRGKNRLITRWLIDIDGARIGWREVDRFDNGKRIIRFSMMKGDFNKYEGRWTLKGAGKNTRVFLNVHVDWGAHKFVSFREVREVLHKKTKKALIGMMIALKKRAERTDNP